MKDYRCKFCHRLLFKYNPIQLEKDVLLRNDTVTISLTELEIKCPKCETINTIKQELRSEDWQFVFGSVKV
jgi:phage FluMu protein Com